MDSGKTAGSAGVIQSIPHYNLLFFIMVLSLRGSGWSDYRLLEYRFPK